MAEPQETRGEQETRWAAQRVTYGKELHDSQAASRRRTVRNVIVAVIVIIVVVVAVVAVKRVW
jgi:t-SNARE complex subunit (syntaxin)